MNCFWPWAIWSSSHLFCLDWAGVFCQWTHFLPRAVSSWSKEHASEEWYQRLSVCQCMRTQKNEKKCCWCRENHLPCEEKQFSWLHSKSRMLSRLEVNVVNNEEKILWSEPQRVHHKIQIPGKPRKQRLQAAEQRKKKIQKENSGVTMERIKMEKRGTAYDAKTNMVALLLWLRCMGATGTWKLVFIGNFTADSRSGMTADLYQCILLRFCQMLQNKDKEKTIGRHEHPTKSNIDFLKSIFSFVFFCIHPIKHEPQDSGY